MTGFQFRFPDPLDRSDITVGAEGVSTVGRFRHQYLTANCRGEGQNTGPLRRECAGPQYQRLVGSSFAKLVSSRLGSIAQKA
jgi:hypothetical protein